MDRREKEQHLRWLRAKAQQDLEEIEEKRREHVWSRGSVEDDEREKALADLLSVMEDRLQRDMELVKEEIRRLQERVEEVEGLKGRLLPEARWPRVEGPSRPPEERRTKRSSGNTRAGKKRRKPEGRGNITRPQQPPGPAVSAHRLPQIPPSSSQGMRTPGI